jgi:hypothetical protein
MSFSSFGNPGAAMGGATPGVQSGPDLQDIQTEVRQFVVKGKLHLRSILMSLHRLSGF